ncbi:hypothetical protein Nepgr_021803 [Nepenthes gracilis]|uniref:Uncharacterized protein n=1 Tax=Nepenthes gracilis TaxID=150966 RepID=A0AAD3XW84_NEPGR|nr:hypothetical protein Nepgr_021803 [Nepenthes gracilis]
MRLTLITNGSPLDVEFVKGRVNSLMQLTWILSRTLFLPVRNLLVSPSQILVLLESENEAEKSTASTRDVLVNPMHDSTQAEGVHKIRSSSMELSANGVDFDLTPNSITNLSCKYPRDASNMAEEVVNDENDFYDPTLNTLKKLLEANAIETYLNSLNPEGRQTVQDFIEKCFRFGEYCRIACVDYYGLLRSSIYRQGSFGRFAVFGGLLLNAKIVGQLEDLPGLLLPSMKKMSRWCLADQRVDRQDGFWLVNKLIGQLSCLR